MKELLDGLRDAVVRAARTYIQVFVGLLAADLLVVDHVESLETGLSLVGTAALAAVPATVSLLQNAVEDKTTVPTVK